MNLFRKRPILCIDADSHKLRRCLTTADLIFLGIGAIIGAGVFVLTGVVAATTAGPAVTLSYAFSGLACLFAALSYAELAASVGGSGSVYTYSYSSFGELIAWIIGWDLLFEYAMSVATVAIGWSGYVMNVLQASHISFPEALSKNPFEGGIINLPAVLIIVVLATLLCVGVKASSRFNIAIVFIKLITIAIFIGVASQHIYLGHWENFSPYGWHGIMQGAALVFFAYIGFDAVSTAAEETITPQRSLPIGIIVSVIVCSLIYIVVSALITLIRPYTTLNVASPIADALIQIGYPIAGGLIAAGAIAGLTTVMLVMYFGLTRIFLAIARDGLLPQFFHRINPHTQTPIRIILSTGLIIATLAGILPLKEAAALVNIGTLTAFTFACGSVIRLRQLQPDLSRPFKLPLNPLFPLLGIFFCGFLLINLPIQAWWRYAGWIVLGFFIYFSYGYKHSRLTR